MIDRCLSIRFHYIHLTITIRNITFTLLHPGDTDEEDNKEREAVKREGYPVGFAPMPRWKFAGLGNRRCRQGDTTIPWFGKCVRHNLKADMIGL
jgi:hypothetical protein